MIFPPRLASARSFRQQIVIVALLAGVALVASAFAVSAEHKPVRTAPRLAAPQWFRGNTHTHTNQSDGDSSPADVAARYKSLGYNFVVITDHNRLTDVDSLNEEIGAPGAFLVMKGEEVTDSWNGKPVHLNAINSGGVVSPQHGADVLGTINNDLAAIRQAGGLPYVAHPNYYFAVSANDLLNSNALLFEVYNAHPVVNNGGDATHSSVEAMWDNALTQGKLLYGIAADDEHTLTNPGGALPGRAWIMVRATSLEPSVITQAIASGDFYASTGITLQSYEVSSSAISIAIADDSAATTIDFIGRSGQLLQRTTGSSATYEFTGHEQYVRAKLLNEHGQAAWTQPVYTERLNPIHPIVNGASMGSEPAAEETIAPDSVATAFGIGLASSAVQAGREADGTFPTSLAGTSVTVNGQAADIFYVSSNQVNFHVPVETGLGMAQVVITKGDGVQMRTQIRVADSAPGIFTEEGNGLGKAVAFDLEKLFGRQLMPTDDNLRRFYLYATGVRGATVVQVTLNGQPVTVERIRACRGLPGLDQITIVFPDDLAQASFNHLQITADGASSNITTLGL